MANTFDVTGLDFSNPLVQATIAALGTAGLASGIVTALQGLGIQQVSPYAAWAGPGQTVTAGQVTTALTPLTQTGQYRSLHVTVDQSGNTTVACTITNYSGNQSMGIAEAFQATNGGGSLTTAQQTLVTAVLALINGYAG